MRPLEHWFETRKTLVIKIFDWSALRAIFICSVSNDMPARRDRAVNLAIILLSRKLIVILPNPIALVTGRRQRRATASNRGHIGKQGTAVVYDSGQETRENQINRVWWFIKGPGNRPSLFPSILAAWVSKRQNWMAWFNWCHSLWRGVRLTLLDANSIGIRHLAISI